MEVKFGAGARPSWMGITIVEKTVHETVQAYCISSEIFLEAKEIVLPERDHRREFLAGHELARLEKRKHGANKESGHASATLSHFSRIRAPRDILLNTFSNDAIEKRKSHQSTALDSGN